MGKLNNWFAISIFCLLIAAIWGLLLRWVFVGGSMGFRYSFFLHAHSHTAILGWGYLGLFTLYMHFFIDKIKVPKKYLILFSGTFATVLAMVVSFSVTGYSVISVVFSTLHIVFAYTFAGFLFAKHKTLKAQPGGKFLLASLAFMILSSFGVWFLAYVFASGLGSSVWYYIAIHFYLHFQFQGWLGMGIFAVFFKWADEVGWHFDRKAVKWFFSLIVISILLNFSMVLFWGFKTQTYFIIHVIGVLIQLAATLLFIKIVWKDRAKIWLINSRPAAYLIIFAFVAFLIKTFIQLPTLVPDLALVAITVRNFSIGFFHLFLLGVFTLFLIGIAGYKLIDINNKTGIIGVITLVTGIVLSELFIFGQGFLLWMNIGMIEFYYQGVFASSALMVIGVACFLVSSFRQKNNL